MTDGPTFDDETRLFVYRFFVEQGRPPVPAEIARAVGRPQDDVEASLTRLAEGHILVLAPGTPYVWMANPFSALPTPFQVDTSGRSYFGSCIWDALGVLAMLESDGDVRTWCPDCSDEIAVSVRDGAASGDGVVHYAVPAARWWDDIGFN